MNIKIIEKKNFKTPGLKEVMQFYAELYHKAVYSAQQTAIITSVISLRNMIEDQGDKELVLRVVQEKEVKAPTHKPGKVNDNVWAKSRAKEEDDCPECPPSASSTVRTAVEEKAVEEKEEEPPDILDAETVEDVMAFLQDGIAPPEVVNQNARSYADVLGIELDDRITRTETIAKKILRKIEKDREKEV